MGGTRLFGLSPRTDSCALSVYMNPDMRVVLPDQQVVWEADSFQVQLV